MNEERFNVVIVGGGVVGCAVARELAATGATVALLEARSDVGDGTSKANTAILPTGFDKPLGSVESQMVQRGTMLLRSYAASRGIATEQPGGLLVAWDDEQAEVLPSLQAKAEANQYRETSLIPASQVYERVPVLAPGVTGGLFVPGEAIIDPWSTTIAFAQEAVALGVHLRLNCRVTGVEPTGSGTTVRTTKDNFYADWVVNAAGLGADYLDQQFGYRRFTVTPRRGELIVFDKFARALVPHIILPVPSSRGKGVLISPTVFGNVMLGPTAEDLSDRTDTSTSEEGLRTLLDKGRRILPALLDEEVVATYAGLRAATEHTDYVIDVDAHQHYVCLGGIRSTGLVSSLAISEYLRTALQPYLTELGVQPAEGPEPIHSVPPLGEAQSRPYDEQESISADNRYGEVVCFCERVTKGELGDAFNSPVPPRDMDGLRRRTRALMGRCGGFYCGANVRKFLEEGRR